MKRREKQFSRREFDTRLVQRALTNPQFRKRLVDNPKGVYASELGRQIPDDVVIRVMEESGSLVYIVIPYSSDIVSEAEAKMLAERKKTHREPCWGLGDGLE
jgi:hypothetical protein